ncbi:MAG TPA: hypothetical protein VGS41_12275, partial [Chthonomonadales bacterium]|nr:hypothetical protein [Chthonomonadales bacterium]
WIVVAIMALLGAGLGPASMSFLVSAQNAVEWRERGVVTAASQFFRSISGAVGVGALGTVLTAGLSQAGTQGRFSASLLLSARARDALAQGALRPMQQALAAALHNVFLLLAAFACGAALLIIGMISRRSLHAEIAVAYRQPEDSEPAAEVEPQPALTA